MLGAIVYAALFIIEADTPCSDIHLKLMLLLKEKVVVKEQVFVYGRCSAADHRSRRLDQIKLLKRLVFAEDRRGRVNELKNRKVLEEDKYAGDQCSMQQGVSIKCNVSGIVL